LGTAAVGLRLEKGQNRGCLVKMCAEYFLPTLPTYYFRIKIQIKPAKMLESENVIFLPFSKFNPCKNAKNWALGVFNKLTNLSI
jgi:hypothetical protein